jgi:hypothetical protein
MDNIRFNARRLARAHRIPGMDAEDFEQDLVADLLHREKAFDPCRASFLTFSDRIVRHRIASLTSPTLRLDEERKLASLDAPVANEDGNEQTLLDLLPDEAAPVDDSGLIRIDVGRFVKELPPPLLGCCEILLAESISAGARAAKIHRSTAYERAERLRERALAQGLAIYVTGSPDSFACPPVDDDRVGLTRPACDSDQQGPHAMGAGRNFPTACLRLSEMDLCAWLAQAEPGDALQYFRGFLTMDRCPSNGRLANPEMAELVRVARRAMSAAESGLAHLVQRKNGPCDYSYLIIARPRPARTEATRTTIHWEA